jgi:hypothetical protein
MGFIANSTNVTDMKVYLTDLGRTLLLNQGFVPSSFSISDDDVNYMVSTSLTQETGDLTGDYSDNLYSISPNIKIKTNIIK